jgi:autoinducer 2-degrading protein
MVGTLAAVRGGPPKARRGGGMVQDLAMLIVHVHVRVRAGRAADFLAATLVNARASLGEPGVLRFDVIQDNDDPNHVVLVEVYRDAGAAAAHKHEPHYATWRDSVAEMMAEPRASAKFSAIFPAGREHWAVGGQPG